MSPPRAAVLLRERDAHQPELAELGDDLVGEALLAIQRLGHRRHLALGEVADGAADQLVVVREVEVHAVILYQPPWNSRSCTRDRLQRVEVGEHVALGQHVDLLESHERPVEQRDRHRAALREPEEDRAAARRALLAAAVAELAPRAAPEAGQGARTVGQAHPCVRPLLVRGHLPQPRVVAADEYAQLAAEGVHVALVEGLRELAGLIGGEVEGLRLHPVLALGEPIRTQREPGEDQAAAAAQDRDRRAPPAAARRAAAPSGARRSRPRRRPPPAAVRRGPRTGARPSTTRPGTSRSRRTAPFRCLSAATPSERRRARRAGGRRSRCRPWARRPCSCPTPCPRCRGGPTGRRRRSA